MECSLEKVVKYASKNTEHAHQVALFMFLAAARALQDKSVEWFVEPFSVYKYERRFTSAQLNDCAELFAIPNGGERNSIVAARMKAEGVKLGVSDLFLPVPRLINRTTGAWACGLWIEMKRPETVKAGKRGKAVIDQAAGGVSSAQAAFMARMMQRGYRCETAWTYIEALECLWRYLNEESPIMRQG